jgi:hypothetical protein
LYEDLYERLYNKVLSAGLQWLKETDLNTIGNDPGRHSEATRVRFWQEKREAAASKKGFLEKLLSKTKEPMGADKKVASTAATPAAKAVQVMMAYLVPPYRLNTTH